MKNVYLFSVNFKTGYGENSGYYLPYSVATLWSYCTTSDIVTDNYKLKGLFYKRLNPREYLKKLDNPSVVGFSAYLWNDQYNLKVIKLIKEKYPNCLIVVGGPSVPQKGFGTKTVESGRRIDKSSLQGKYKYADVLVHSEGEITFKQILETYIDTNDFSDVKGLSFKKDGIVISTPPQLRVENLDDIPSPYTIGLFDDILKEEPNAKWSMVMETDRGCPYKCTFCDWGTLTYSKLKKFGRDRVYDEIEWVNKEKIDFVNIANANFGIYNKRDLAIADHMVKCKVEQGYPSAYQIAWAKNSNERILGISEKMNDVGLMRGLTLSFQSMNPETLKVIERSNMKIQKFEEIIEKCDEKGIPNYTEIILGLPLETLDTWKKGINDLLEAGQHTSMDLWFCEILEGAPLNDKNLREVFGIKTKPIKNYITNNNPEDDPTPEIVELVYETNTMPFTDWLDAVLFNVIIINFHVLGWTQYVSRYLNKYYNVSYYKFYDELQKYIVENKELFLNYFYELHSTDIREVLETKDYSSRKDYDDINILGWYFYCRLQFVLHKNKTQVFQELQNFYKEQFGDVDKLELSEIVEFNKDLIVDFNNVGSIYKIYSKSYYNLYMNKEVINETTGYNFYPKETWTDFQDFAGKLVGRRKIGFGKNMVDKVPSSKLPFTDYEVMNENIRNKRTESRRVHIFN